ncbi:MAG: hypothetical protein IPP49_01385 [Saprospiraceae bacterium]|nr:hypothetical protein [Saprospiraceae bacterium]
MNTKMIIGALVGGLLVFFWQFLSWSLVNVHSSEQKYTPHQDSILQNLSAQLTEDGTYFLPMYPPGASMEEQQKVMDAGAGKPWAQISFHKAMNTNMSMNMIRGYLADVVAVLLLCWLLAKIQDLTFMTAVIASVTVGIIGYLTTSYTNSIWFENNSIPDLIDAIVAWVLCGAWLGWWLRR